MAPIVRNPTSEALHLRDEPGESGREGANGLAARRTVERLS